MVVTRWPRWDWLAFRDYFVAQEGQKKSLSGPPEQGLTLPSFVFCWRDP